MRSHSYDQPTEVRWDDYGNRKVYVRNRPFGFMAPNGMNFARSVNDPTSRIARLINYLRQVGEADKNQILRVVFKIGTDGYEGKRGWGCFLFSLGTKCGFLSQRRVGNKVMWSVGPNHIRVCTPQR